MLRRPPTSTRSDPLFPSPPLFRSDLLAQVRVPTLVLHGSRDQIAPLSQGCALAAGIPGATFVQLETENHVLLEDEPAWGAFREAVLEFTGLARTRSEEHTSELQSLMRSSYAGFCLKKKNSTA